MKSPRAPFLFLAAVLLVSTRAVGGQSVAVNTTVARLGDYVERYYSRAQSIVVEESVSVQPLARDLSSDGFARRLTYELRFEWNPEAGNAGDPATVTRVLLAVNGRPPREGQEPKCMDPRSVSPEPLAFLLPDRRHRFRFAAAGLGRVDGRVAMMIDYQSLEPEPPKAEFTDDCASIELPGRSRGRIWADPETAEILRFDEGITGMVDVPVPPKHQRLSGVMRWTVERADTTVRYRRVTFTDPDESMLLPDSIDTLTIVQNSGSQRTRITQRFSNYRRFVTGSRIVR